VYVGSKNENPERTGLLIFEHLLFEGTEKSSVENGLKL
jgi:hypothetical protein